MSKKFTSTIAGASLLITTVGLLSRGLGFIREAVYAKSFGLNIEFDIYLIGAVVPLTINAAVLYLAQNYFIPSYHKKLQESKEEAQLFFNNTFWLFVISSIALAAILAIASSLIIDLYLGSSGNELKKIGVTVFRIFIITIPLHAAFSILSSYMYSEFSFKSPAIAALFFNIAVILLVLFFSESWGVYTIPVGFVAGTFFQLLYILLALKKSKELLFPKLKFRFSWSGSAKNILVFIILIEVINQLYILVDRFFFSSVQPGGIASLNYATVLFTLPITIFSLALSTAIFPKLSHSFNAKNFELLQLHFNRGIRINIFIFVPLTFTFIFFGDYVIKYLYQRGEFNSNDTLMTFNVLRIYSLSLIFYTSYAVINKMIYGASFIKQLLIISVIIFILKIVLNFILVDLMDTEGLALSTAICYTLLSISGYLLVVFKLKLKGINEIFFNAVIFIISALAALFISNQISSLYRFTPFLNFLCSFSVFTFVYWINIHLIKPEEYDWVKAMFGQMIKKNGD